MASASDLKKALPSYFNLDDIRPAGAPGMNLTIRAAGVEQVGQDKEEKPVLRFRETAAGLVLNATRVGQLAELFGDADLVGKTINIAAEVLKAPNGRSLEQISIREVK